MEWKASQSDGDKKAIEEEARVWQALDSLIEPLPVTIPYAKALSRAFPVQEERFMRDFDKIEALIKASALWHQFQRPKTEKGEIIAQPEDYLLVYALRDLIAQSISRAPEPIIRFLETAKRLSSVDEHGNHNYPTREGLIKELGVSERTVKRYIKYCLDEELIETYGKGKKQGIKVLDIPEPISPLPSPEKLFNLSNVPMSQINKVLETLNSEAGHIRMSHPDPMTHPGGEAGQTGQGGTNGSVPIQAIDNQGEGKNGTMGHGNGNRNLGGETTDVEEALYELFGNEGEL